MVAPTMILISLFEFCLHDQVCQQTVLPTRERLCFLSVFFFAEYDRAAERHDRNDQSRTAAGR